MTTLTTLFFPDTVPFSTKHSPLLLVFSKLHRVALLEHDKEGATCPKLLQNRCQIWIPAPLGEDRERFLYLLNDIKNRKDDYSAQLSHLTLASLSQPQGLSDTTRGIMSSIRGNTTTKNNNSEASSTLWQARLLLAMAEILDTEEEELQGALRFLEKEEHSLFQTLKGEAEDMTDSPLAAPTELPSSSVSLSSAAIARRMSAWLKLWSTAPETDFPVWTTNREEVFEILAENHTAKEGKEPQYLGRLLLPLRLNDNNIQHLTAFSSAAAPILEELTEALSVTPEQMKELPDTTVTAWQTLLDEFFPAQHYGRTFLDFHLFAAPLSHYFTSGTNKGDPCGPQLAALYTQD